MRACVHACMRVASMRDCVRAGLRACVDACVKACMHACVRACVHVSLSRPPFTPAPIFERSCVLLVCVVAISLFDLSRVPGLFCRVLFVLSRVACVLSRFLVLFVLSRFVSLSQNWRALPVNPKRCCGEYIWSFHRPGDILQFFG